MAERNPFLDSDDPRPAANPPQVPISGNPFVAPPINAPHPSTLVGNVTDTLNAANNTATFGMWDRARGAGRALTGDAPSYSAGVDQAVADTAMRRERSPLLSVVGDVAGGTAQAMIPGAGVIGRTAGVALGGASPGIRGTIGRMAGYGLEGGVLGAGQAAGHTYSGNAEDYASNAMRGGVFGAALGAPFGKFADVAPRSTAKVPNSEELKKASGGSYRQTHAVPIDYPAPAFWNGLDTLEQRLLSTTNPVKSPAVWETMRLARQGRPQANQPGVTATVSPKNIDDLRQQLTGVREPGAYQARQWLDDFMERQTPSRGGQSERDKIALLLSRARGDWRAGKRTQTIEETNQYAADRAVPANSGKNVANTYGSKLTDLLAPSSREGKWYNPAEKADIRATVKRDAVEDFKRTLSNIGGGGGGWAAGSYGLGGLGTGYMTGDLLPAAVGVGVPAASMLLKGSSNRNMVREADALADRMAMNSPLYRHRAANAPVVAGPGLGNTAESTRNAITNQVLEQLRLRGLMQPPEE